MKKLACEHSFLTDLKKPPPTLFLHLFGLNKTHYRKIITIDAPGTLWILVVLHRDV